MDNSINFKGAFLIKKPTPVLKDFLKTSVGKKEKIYENFAGKEDFLCVVNNASDKRIALTLINIPNINFKYYPGLSPKSGFEEDQHLLSNILSKAKDTVITTKSKLLETLRNKSSVILKTNIRRIQEKNLKVIEKETFIDLDNKDYRKDIDVQTGICRIFTKVKNYKTGKYSRHTLVEITPPGEMGYCYAKYTPVSVEEKTRRIAIKNGEKIFEYTEPASSNFKKNEQDAKKYYIEQISKKW